MRNSSIVFLMIMRFPKVLPSEKKVFLAKLRYRKVLKSYFIFEIVMLVIDSESPTYADCWLLVLDGALS